MFEKVSKLKKFGIFRDFSWDTNTPNFARFNLIYGWNKSGKTTLSRAFVACEKKTTDFRNYPRDKDGNIIGEFEIKTNVSLAINRSNCQSYTGQIRVFNKDFIEDNVSFNPENPSKPIVYVSEEDIESSRKLNGLRGKIDSLEERYGSTKRDRQRSEKAEDDFRKSTARNIKNIVGNFNVYDKYRSYDKGKVKTTIENTGIDKFSRLSDEEFEKKIRLIGSDPLNTQTLLSQYGFSFSYGGKNLNSFSEVSSEVSKLLKRKVVAETIDRFKDDPALNQWAQRGFELHKTKGEEEKCLFCQNEFSKGFINSLSNHFSDDYGKLQRDIDSFIKSLEKLKLDKIAEKNQDLYPDLQGKYESSAEDINKIIGELTGWVEESIKQLREKHDNPLTEIKDPQPPKDFSAQYDEKVKRINTIIKKHNTRVDNHEQAVGKAKKELENHLIAVAIEEQEYSKIKSEFDNSVILEEKARKAVEDNNKEISKLEKKTSNIGEAVEKINEHLEEFFGRKEISLELDDTKKGYVIKRDKDVAHNLSEGEKNAIAFSYFIVKTQEQGFKVKEGIIVIDDPISSFDSNFIYHCFSLIKNHFEDAKQLIVSTHNLEFFNLVKDWFEQKNRNSDKKPIPCEFFMIENTIEDDKRCASIIPLEETLRKFKSEYHFLFSRLNKFITEDTSDYADFYTIGNIARRFLEIYINFKIPTTGDLKSKVDQLDTQTVSKTEKGKVYKLIQEFSHGFDPASIIEHKDKSEIKDAIKVLMKIVEESDKKHFESLQSNLQPPATPFYL